MSLGYAKEKLAETVELLATGEGDVRSRLQVSFVAFALVPSADLPDELRVEYEGILAKMGVGAPEQGVLKTIGKMKNKTGAKIAQRILTLNATVGELPNE